MNNPNNRIVVTYCSREKSSAPDSLPAVERYESPRISTAFGASLILGFEFLILSGLYGLLGPHDQIPDYDHLLNPEHVPEHARKLEEKLKLMNPDNIVFVSRSLNVDPGTIPYREAMRLACEAVEVPFHVLEIGSDVPSSPDLAALIKQVLS